MGGNAVRTSHNMPTPEWVEACDRMGMMMMCETRQMSSSPEGLAQLERHGQALSQLALASFSGPSATRNGSSRTRWPKRARRSAPPWCERCHELDPTRAVSAAVNGNNKKGRLRFVRCHRIQLQPQISRRVPPGQPTRPVYGSETASAISTRGEYTTDPLRNTVSAYDVNRPAGERPLEEWWTFYGTSEWEA